jgi:hypothetical protein
MGFRADKRFETLPRYYDDFAMQPTVDPRVEGLGLTPVSLACSSQSPLASPISQELPITP